jgi:di/tricarboxylate transporter
MIAAAARFLARVLVEFGLLLLLAGALFVFLAFRTVRRFLVSSEDPLEGYSRPLVHLLHALVELAGAARAGKA